MASARPRTTPSAARLLLLLLPPLLSPLAAAFAAEPAATRFYVKGYLGAEGGVTARPARGAAAEGADGRRYARLVLELTGGIRAVPDATAKTVTLRLTVTARDYLDLRPVPGSISLSRPLTLRVDVPDEAWIEAILVAGARAKTRVELHDARTRKRRLIPARVVDIGRGIVEAEVEGL